MKHSSEELRNIPLTGNTLQSCFKSKTYVRDGEWHILWHLGGKNNVTIGEKRVTKPINSSPDELTEVSEFYYIPPKETDEQTIVDLLPKGIVHCESKSAVSGSVHLNTLADLEKVFPEFIIIISKGKLRI